MPDVWERFFRNTGRVEDPRQSTWQRADHGAHGTASPRRALYCSPRLGKSLVALAGLDAVAPARALITCPLVAASQWKDYCDAVELESFDLSRRSCSYIAAHLKNYRGIVILNDDKLGPLVEEIKAWKPVAYVADEVHREAGVSTARSRAYRRVAWSAQWVRNLTGTPVTNHYGSLWAPMAGLSRDDWGTSYESFARRFLIRDAMFPSRVIGYQNEPELFELIRKWATIKRREDVFGPDCWQPVIREVELPASVTRMYERLARQWLLDEPELTTKTVLDRMIRLHQLTSGFLPDDQGEYHEIHAAKREMILADLDEIVASGEKAVIFHQFTPEGDALFADCATTFKKVPVLKLDGRTSNANRERLYEVIENHDGPAIAVIQVQSGNTARSLANAKHVMFASRNFSFVEQEQARDRVFAPGVPRVVYDYVAAGTIDFYILDVLGGKQSLHTAVRHADIRDAVFGASAHRRKRRAA